MHDLRSSPKAPLDQPPSDIIAIFGSRRTETAFGLDITEYTCRLKIIQPLFDKQIKDFFGVTIPRDSEARSCAAARGVWIAHEDILPHIIRGIERVRRRT